MRTRRTATLLRAAALGISVLAGGAGCRATNRREPADHPDRVPDDASDAADDEGGDDFDDAS